MSTSRPVWSKSSYSSAQGDDCVEVAATEHAICVRDSKDAPGPQLTIAREDWARFVRSTSRG